MTMLTDAHLHSNHAPGMAIPPSGIFLSCAASRKDWEPLLGDKRIIPFLGIHPEKISAGWEEDMEILDELLARHPRAGIGECGLDRRFYRESPRSLQEEILKGHLRLARKLGRSLALHQVRAGGALADFLQSERHDGPVMIHGFSGSPELLRRFLSLGLFISLGPEYPWEEENFAAMAAAIPRERLLLETDWPFPSPEGADYGGQLNAVYRRASRALTIDRDALAAIVQKNGTIFTH